MDEDKYIWQQLVNVRRRRVKGSLDSLQAKLWHAINVCCQGLELSLGRGDEESIARWINLLVTVSHCYAKIAMASDLEQRVKSLEAKSSIDDVFGARH